MCFLCLCWTGPFIRVTVKKSSYEEWGIETEPMLIVFTLTDDIFIVFATYFNESYYVICPKANLNKTVSLDIAAFEF